jgi:hypothetical protein
LVTTIKKLELAFRNAESWRVGSAEIMFVLNLENLLLIITYCKY